MDPISSSTFSSSLGTTTPYNAASLQQLEQQKAELTRKIQEEQNSKDDEKTKQAKIQQMRTQLAQVERRISEMKAKEQRKSESSELQTKQTQKAEGDLNSTGILA
jgi:hypothetical protein